MNGVDGDYGVDYDQEIETYNFSMDNFWVHDEFESDVKYFDVAIIKLNSRVKLGDNVNTICLTMVSSWVA